MKKNIKYGIYIIILILIVGIIIFTSLEKSKSDTNQGTNKTNIEKNNSKSSEKQERSVSNSNIEVESYNGKDTVLYKYTIYNNQGKKVYEDDDLSKEPVIEELDNEIISIVTSAGTGLCMVQYYDKFNDRVSDIFTNPLDLKGEKVIFFNKNKLVVQNIFNKLNYYKEIKLNTTDTADPNNAIKSAEFIDDNQIRVIYFSGTDYKEVTEKFYLNL